MHSNIHIISNQYVWDKDGKAIGVKQPIIHGMNKDETMVKNFPDIFKQIEHRTDVMLIGDSENDLEMITGYNYTTLLTVGFTQFGGIFHITLSEQSDMSPLLKMLQDILA